MFILQLWPFTRYGCHLQPDIYGIITYNNMTYDHLYYAFTIGKGPQFSMVNRQQHLRIWVPGGPWQRPLQQRGAEPPRIPWCVVQNGTS